MSLADDPSGASSVLRRSELRGRDGLRLASGAFLVHSPDPDAFEAVVEDFTWADTRVQHLRVTKHRAVRTSAQIARHPADGMVVTCLLHGEIRARYTRDVEDVRSGDVTLLRGDTEVHYQTRTDVETFSVVLPRRSCGRLLPMRDALPDGPIVDSRVVDGLQSLMTTVLAVQPVESVVVARHLVESVSSLALAALNEVAGVEEAAPDRSELLRRVYAYVAEHLADRRLTPTTIADEFGISLRSLHALFDGEPETLARYIRNRRLDGVHGQLTSGRTPTSAALRDEFGFTSTDQMGRAFRQRFGTSIDAVRRASP